MVRGQVAVRAPAAAPTGAVVWPAPAAPTAALPTAPPGMTPWPVAGPLPVAVVGVSLARLPVLWVVPGMATTSPVVGRRRVVTVPMARLARLPMTRMVLTRMALVLAGMGPGRRGC